MRETHKIPVSVVVITRNEAAIIKRCLAAFTADFDEVFVVDSESTDKTKELAKEAGAEVVNFKWDGKYPKKKQRSLEKLPLRNDWVFMVDADEVVTEKLIEEIRELSISYSSHAGYFVKGLNVVDGKVLRFGLSNNKLMLINRTMMEYPVVDDLDIPGGSEVEGHYQPVLKTGCEGGKFGQLKAPLLHHIHEGAEDWKDRHKRYAEWEAGMAHENAWPEDPVKWRQFLKQVLRTVPIRHYLVFLYGYILKAGFIGGQQAYNLSRDKFRYGALTQSATDALKESKEAT